MTFTKTSAGLLIAVMAVMSVPALTHAQEEDVREGSVCNRLDTISDTVLDAVQERADEGLDKHDEATDTHEANWQERLDELESNRADDDAKWADVQDDLRDKADTDDREAAVEDFIDTVDSLVSDRRASVDVAIDDFKTGITDLFVDRRDSFDTESTDFITAMEGAFDVAEEICEDDPEAFTRDDLRDEIKEVREEFAERRQEIADEHRSRFTDLRDARETAVQAAVDTFTAGMEDARDDLKAVFDA